MQFSVSDEGPCYLSLEQHRELRYDRVLADKKQVELTKSEMVDKLKAAGKGNPKGSKKTLQTICQNMGIATSVERNKIIQGWVDKPKGSLQILYERGWIHPDRIGLYTEKGKTVNGVAPGDLDPIDELSIKQLMKLQKDFINEITLLQYYGSLLGITVDRTPKCHPELAGEGIEYAWAIAKLHYKRMPLDKKRTKAGFKNLVLESLDPIKVLTLERVRLCSRKARNYMKLYKAMEGLDTSDCHELTNKHSILEDSMKLYKKLKKVSKTHRSVMDKNMRDVREIEAALPNRLQSFESTVGKDIKKKTVCLLVKKMNSM